MYIYVQTYIAFCLVYWCGVRTSYYSEAPMLVPSTLHRSLSVRNYEFPVARISYFFFSILEYHTSFVLHPACARAHTLRICASSNCRFLFCLCVCVWVHVCDFRNNCVQPWTRMALQASVHTPRGADSLIIFNFNLISGERNFHGFRKNFIRYRALNLCALYGVMKSAEKLVSQRSQIFSGR